MKLVQPLYAFVLILTHFTLTLIDYYKHLIQVNASPEFCCFYSGWELLYAVILMGGFEMFTPKGWFKQALRIFLACIVFGTLLLQFFDCALLYHGILNSSLFMAVLLIFVGVCRITRVVFN